MLFPHAVLPLTVGRESSVQLINSLGEDKTIIVVAQREARVDSPQPSDLYTVGTSAIVHKSGEDAKPEALFVFAEGSGTCALGRVYPAVTTIHARQGRADLRKRFLRDSSEIEALQREMF